MNFRHSFSEFFSKPITYINGKTFLRFVIVTFIPIVIVYLLSLMYGTSDDLSVRNILYVMSNTDMTSIFKTDLDHLRDLFDLFQKGTASFGDLLDVLWTLIQLVFDFGWNIINTLWTLIKVILVVIGAL